MKRDAKVALLLFLAAAAIFLLTAFDRVKHPTAQIHFVDLAESWMHGRLDTETPKRYSRYKGKPSDPPGLQEAVNRILKSGGWNDWASYRVLKLKNGTTIKGVFPYNDSHSDQKYRFITLNGEHRVVNPNKDLAQDCGPTHHSRCDRTKYFVSFPPFPAVVFLPFAAIWGYHFNDVIFTALNGALNVTLIFLFLQFLARAGLSRRTLKENVILAVLFGFGTVHYFSTVRGEVWFTALIMGVTLNIFYMWFAMDARKPLLAGVFLALSTATRTPIAFGVVFFLLEVFRTHSGTRAAGSRETVKKFAWFFLPLVITAGVLMVYNYARFDNPLEFGHRYLQAGARPSIREHGLFSMWFLNRNLSAALVHLPVIDGVKPYIHITRNGLSILFLTPVFILLLWPGFKSGQNDRRTIYRNLMLASLAIFIPHVLYQNTGWAQFGFRFSLDFTPYLIAALAMSNRPINRRFLALTAIAIVLNLFGAVTFGRFNQFYYD